MGTSDWIQPPDETRTRALSGAAGATLVTSNVGSHESEPPWWVWPVPAPPVEPGAWTVLYDATGSTIRYIRESADPPLWTASQTHSVHAWAAGARDLTPVDPVVPTGTRVEWESDTGVWADDQLHVVIAGAVAPDTPETLVRVAALPAGWSPGWPAAEAISLTDWITPTDLDEWPSDTGSRPARPTTAPGGTVALSVPYDGDPRVVLATEAAWVAPPVLLDLGTQQVALASATATFRYTPPRYRLITPGGAWRLRQRQTLTGTDGWPLRQRQNGGHSGSWPLRQRQRGV